MNQGDLRKVWEIKSLKRKPAEGEARKILERIAHRVQPIMRKRQGRVELVSEFWLNGDDHFYPYDQVIDTMLHKLCHNMHGTHDAKFYKLWDELRKCQRQECEELMTKGITSTSQGFDLPGRRLGGFSKKPPISSLRQTALAAAERRAVLGSLLPSGPRRLGGDSSIMVLSPAQAAAMDAERRLQDDIWCGSQFEDGGREKESNPDILRNIENEIKTPSKSSHDNAGSQATHSISRKRIREMNEASASQSSGSDVDQNYVDLTGNDGTCGAADDLSCAHQRRKFESDNVFDSKFKCHLRSASSGMQSNLTSWPGLKDTAKHPSVELLMWASGMCTLLNPPLDPICEICGFERLKDNSVGLERCEQWRYSHGPPVSARAPCRG